MGGTIIKASHTKKTKTVVVISRFLVGDLLPASVCILRRGVTRNRTTRTSLLSCTPCLYPPAHQTRWPTAASLTTTIAPPIIAITCTSCVARLQHFLKSQNVGCPTISTGLSNARLHRACAFERLSVGTGQPSQMVEPLASWCCGDIQKARSAASERYILVPTSVILANHLMMRRRTSYYMLPGIAITKLKYLAQRPGSGRKKKAITSRSVFVITLYSTAGFCGPNFGIEMQGEKFVLARRLNAYRERTHRRDGHRIGLWRFRRLVFSIDIRICRPMLERRSRCTPSPSY